MGIGWERIEAMARAVDLTEGLSAPVADALWLLSRQWQVGEFTGDDAAQPAAVRVRRRTHALTTLTSDTGGSVAFPRDRPLEAVVEALADTDLGSAGLYAAARAGQRLATALRDAGLQPAIAALRAAFPLPAPAPALDAGPRQRAAADLVAHWGLDAAAVATGDPMAALAAVLSPTDLDAASTIVTAWREDYLARNQSGFTCWDPQRLEYAFSVGTRNGLSLTAPEHDGGHLDWYSFDLAGEPATPGTGGPTATTAIPTPVRYPGMPASRWWELEAPGVNFGDLNAGPADLARLLVAEFTVAYADDWFVTPLRIPTGSITEVTLVEVYDNFGGRTVLPSTAMSDHERAGSDRAWRLFELDGDIVGPDHPSPWLLLPTPSADAATGPAVERVSFARDEATNLAWAVEHVIEGPLGRPVRRAETWRALRPEPDAATDPSAAPTPADDSAAWRYRLEAPAPPWWIPLRPERISATSPQIRLRRARMQAWELLEGEPAGPRSVLLDPRAPRWLYEEEVPAAPIEVTRSWQLARWTDGSVHVWQRHRKRPGHPMPGSGLRWDVTQT